MQTPQAALLLRHIRKLAAPAEEADSDRELLRRFSQRRDEEAFAVLLRRHGPMVLRVCRRMAGNDTDAEDAFQATFLTLARNCGAIRSRHSAAGWLYGVACNTARKVRDAAVRRSRHERAVPVPSSTDPLTAMSARELLMALDDELSRLPEKYRAPLVICYLEGMDREEAAQRLGCPLGTLKGRLERGKERLRTALERRGLSLSAALAAALVGRETTEAAVPSLLARTTLRTALGTAPAAVGFTMGKVAVAVFIMALVTVGVVGWVNSSNPEAHGWLSVGLDPEDSTHPTKNARVDAFGDPLPAEAIARIGTVRFRHGNDIQGLQFTPDGKELIAHGFREGITVWDATTGRELRKIVPEKLHQIIMISLSADGRLIAGTVEHRDGIGKEFPVVIWDRMTGAKLKEIGKAKHAFPVFAPDGKVLAVIDYDGHVALWDVDSGRLLRSWQVLKGWISNALFLPDGKTLMTGGSDQAVRFWDVATGNKVRELAGLVSTAGSLAVSPDGKRLASVVHKPSPPGVIGGERPGNEMQIWDIASGKELRRLSVPVGIFDPETTFQLWYPAFSHDGKLLAATGVDEFLHLWDADTGKEVRRMALGANSQGRPVFAPDDRVLAVTSHQNAIRLFETASGKEVSPAGDAPFRQFLVALTPDNRHIIAPDYHSSVSIWDAKSGNRTGRLAGHEKPVYYICLARDGRRLYTTDLGSTVHCWDLATRRELYRFSQESKPALRVADVSPDGKLLAVVEGGMGLPLVDTSTGKEVRRLPLDNQTNYGAVFTPDGRTVIAWNGEHGAMFLDVATGKQLRRIEYREAPFPGDRAGLPVMMGGPRLYYHAALSPDGRLIAFGTKNRMIALHDVASGKEVRRIEELPDMPDQVVFSPDGRTLAWGGYYHPAVHLLETVTLAERYRLTGHKGGIVSLTFSTDGKLLVSSARDATALVWDLRAPAQGALDLDAAWTDLAGDDAAKAYQQMRRLAAAHAATIHYLDKRLQPVAAVDEKHLVRLLADLDNEQFAVRERARKELEQLGDLAASACRKALENNPSPEARRRLEQLLEKQTQHLWSPSPELLRTLRALEVLEHLATPEARQLLEKLAGGAPAAQQTREAKAALERLRSPTH
jgi:RNA polymerase sigma factor (sigma-70 family)